MYLAVARTTTTHPKFGFDAPLVFLRLYTSRVTAFRVVLAFVLLYHLLRFCWGRDVAKLFASRQLLLRLLRRATPSLGDFVYLQRF